VNCLFVLSWWLLDVLALDGLVLLASVCCVTHLGHRERVLFKSTHKRVWRVAGGGSAKHVQLAFACP
jgi:hypothetical protein